MNYVKQYFLVFLLIIFASISFSNLKVVFDLLIGFIKGEEMSILFMAWPIVLAWLLIGVFFLFLTIVTWKKIKALDKNILKVKSSEHTSDSVLMRPSPIVKFGIALFVLILLIPIIVSIFKYGSSFLH